MALFPASHPHDAGVFGPHAARGDAEGVEDQEGTAEITTAGKETEGKKPVAMYEC